MITILILSLFTAILTAPSYPVGYIVKVEEINEYENLIRAVVMVESSGGKYLYNAEENAVGPFQIRQVRIDHYNKLTGSSYSLNDCYDYELSRKVFLYFTKGRNYEVISRAWCGGEGGTKKATEKYYLKIQKVLLSLKADSQD